MSEGRRERAFLVRMWTDPAMPAGEWRGSIHEVGTDRRLYIAGPGEIAAYIASALLRADPAMPEDIG